MFENNTELVPSTWSAQLSFAFVVIFDALFAFFFKSKNSVILPLASSQTEQWFNIQYNSSPTF